jgi:hypothetical protein
VGLQARRITCGADLTEREMAISVEFVGEVGQETFCCQAQRMKVKIPLFASL